MADEGSSISHEGSSICHEGSRMADEGSRMADDGSSISHEGSSSAHEWSSMTNMADESCSPFMADGGGGDRLVIHRQHERHVAAMRARRPTRKAKRQRSLAASHGP